MCDIRDLRTELRELRSEVLDQPVLLLGLKYPPIDAFWGYMDGLRQAIDILEGRSFKLWSEFLQKHKGFGARTDYRIIRDDGMSSPQAAEFLKELYAEFDEWLETHTPQ